MMANPSGLTGWLSRADGSPTDEPRSRLRSGARRVQRRDGTPTCWPMSRAGQVEHVVTPGADPFAERDQQLVDLDPVALRQDLSECFHRLLGSLRRDEMPA